MRSLLILAVLSILSGRATADQAADRSGDGPRLPLSLDLSAAMRLAIEHNPGLKQVRERMKEQDGIRDEIQAGRRLKLKLTGGWNTFDEQRLQAFGPDAQPEATRWNGGAESSITVFSNGRSKAALQAEAFQRKALAGAITASERNLLARVQETFLDARLAQETRKVQQEAIKVLEEQRVYVHHRFESGVGARFDVKQADVALANARPPLIRAENAYRRGVDQLRRLIGLSYADNQGPRAIELKPSPANPDLPLTLQEALARAGSERPELEDIAARIEAQRMRIALDGKGTSPLIDLFAGYGVEGDQFGGSDPLYGWTTGLRFNWAFSDGGASKARAKQSRSRLEQLVHEEADLRLDIEGEVRSAYFDFEEAGSILVSAALVIEEAEEALSLARNRFKAGRGTQLELLESQLQLTRSRLNEAEARHDLQRAIIAIRRSSGLGL